METLYHKVLQRDSSTNPELFWDVKIICRDFGRMQIERNRHVFCNITIKSKFKKIPVQNSNSKLCTGIFDFWKQLKCS